MSPGHRREKAEAMDRGELRDSEIERELDSLYRKVAGLDQGEEGRQETIKGRSGQKKRHPFRTVGFAWGIAFGLFFLGMLGLLWWQGGDRRERYAIQIRAYPEDQKQNAVTFVADLRKRAPDVSMETVVIPGRGVWHRVLLGNFSTAEEAAEYQKSDRVAREHPYRFIQRKLGNGP
jgi:hypothetical protein